MDGMKLAYCKEYISYVRTEGVGWEGEKEYILSFFIPMFPVVS